MENLNPDLLDIITLLDLKTEIEKHRFTDRLSTGFKTHGYCYRAAI
jgi:hypothetical protein